MGASGGTWSKTSQYLQDDRPKLSRRRHAPPNTSKHHVKRQIILKLGIIRFNILFSYRNACYKACQTLSNASLNLPNGAPTSWFHALRIEMDLQGTRSDPAKNGADMRRLPGRVSVARRPRFAAVLRRRAGETWPGREALNVWSGQVLNAHHLRQGLYII